jgi:ATP-dependent Clp protease protease subunit
MLHSLSGGTRGKIEDMRIDHKESEFLQSYLNTILAKNCIKTVAKIKKDCDRDFWMSSEEAVNYGLIDEVI